MRRRAWSLVCAAAWVIPAATLAAQTPRQPRLYLSLFTGYRGGGQLWVLHDQPVAVLVSSGDTALFTNTGQYDTLDMVRQVTPSFLVGTSGAYFPTQSLGLQAEIAFLSMSLESRCAIRQYQPADSNDIDPQVCNSLTGQSVTTGAVSISLGMVGRINPAGRTTPYALVNGGLLVRSRGTIAMRGTYTTANQSMAEIAVLEDPHPRTTDLHLTVGAGVAFSLGPSYQIRFEGRDVLARLERITGPGDPNAAELTPPHEGHFYHNLAFIVALDVVFEQRRGRRY